MSELKTKPNNLSVVDFLNSIDHPQKKEDAKSIYKLMEEITQTKGVMWGSSIIGFGNYHYKYKTGREGDWFLTGFSPRKQNLTLYIMDCFYNTEDLLKKLGKYKTGKSCLYINKLQDVDIEILKKLVENSVNHLKAKYSNS